MKKRVLNYLTFVALMIFITSCGSSKQLTMQQQPSTPTIWVERATDELLKKFYLYEFDEENNDGERIVIWANMPLNIFSFITIGFDESLFVERILYTIGGQMWTQMAVAIRTTTLSEGIPTRGISFRVDENTVRYFYISQSGVDGSLSLVEFFPTRVAW